MLKPPPKDITIPAHLTHLGCGGEFVMPDSALKGDNDLHMLWASAETPWVSLGFYHGDDPDRHYAAPHDSEIVRANLPALPPVPEGYDRWELRGLCGLEGDQDAPWAASDGLAWVVSTTDPKRIEDALGYGDIFYAIAVRDKAPAPAQESKRDALREAYLVTHNASGFRVGDKVRVLREATDYEAGWRTVWAPAMDCMVGGVHSITGDSQDRGFVLNGDFHFPWFVLELVERAPESVTLTVGNYDANITAERAVVGGQTIPFAQVEAVYNAMQKLRKQH